MQIHPPTTHITTVSGLVAFLRETIQDIIQDTIQSTIAIIKIMRMRIFTGITTTLREGSNRIGILYIQGT